MFASLFTVTGLSAAFDDAVIADAKNGRIFRPFANLAATELGLPLLKKDGNPVNKAALLKLTGEYVAAVRAKKPVGPKAWAKRVALGRALETIASAMDPAFPAIGGADAWEALKPVRAVKPKADAAPAPAGDDADEEGTEATTEATTPAATLPGVALGDALATVLDAIRAGALSGAQRAALVAALADTSAVPERMAQLSHVPALSGDALEFPALDAGALPLVTEVSAEEADALQGIQGDSLPEVSESAAVAAMFAAEIRAVEAAPL